MVVYHQVQFGPRIRDLVRIPLHCRFAESLEKKIHRA